MLSERCGVPAPTIRDIETGKMTLTEGVARKIMLATGVSIQSLLKAEDPLKDVLGEKLTSASNPELRISSQQIINMQRMIDAALKASEEKHRSAAFNELFIEWLPQALEAIGALDAMKKVLTRNLGVFDPDQVPPALWPKDPKTKRLWENARNELFKAVAEEAGSLEKWDQAYQTILADGRLRKQPGG
jgi:hypothetical protein